MRDILFKGKCIDDGEWIEGYYLHKPNDVCVGESNEEHLIVKYRFLDWSLSELVAGKVLPESVCQYTGMHEFKNGSPEINNRLFEGDIVEVRSRRRLPTESFYTEKSKYDGECHVRATIVFRYGTWRLDYDNVYNHKLAAARGHEEYDRVVNNSPTLYEFGIDSGYKPHRDWNDIVCIGNIIDNPELLED